MIRSQERGFTLLELIVAISIFGVISVMAYSALQQIGLTASRFEQRSEQLADLQRAFFVISKDFQQLADREIRDQFGDPQPAFITEQQGRVEFTRSGWRNPLSQPRSVLQRVSYRLEDEVLYRDYWRVLDRAQDSEPLGSAILTQVEALELELFDPESREWQSTWPPYNPDPNQPVASLPVAVKVSITIKGIGEVWRIYSVAQG